MVDAGEGVAGTDTHERIPTLEKAGGNITVKKADILATHFTKKVTTLEAERQPPHLIYLDTLSLDTIIIAEDFIARLLRSFNTRKALGPDGSSLYLLHTPNCAVLAKPLMHIFLQCLHTGT